MTVRELIDRLGKCDPDAMVLLYATDPKNGSDEGWWPLHSIEIDPAVQMETGDWMYVPDGRPAIWLWGEDGVEGRSPDQEVA